MSKKLSKLKQLILSGPETLSHKRSWMHLETTILTYRSMTAMALITLFDAINLFSGESSVFHANSIIEGVATIKDGKEYFNYDVAMNLALFAGWASIVGVFVRVILLLISIKKPVICRIYFGYELLMLIFNECLVNVNRPEANDTIQMLKIIICFISFNYKTGTSFIQLTIC